MKYLKFVLMFLSVCLLAGCQKPAEHMEQKEAQNDVSQIKEIKTAMETENTETAALKPADCDLKQMEAENNASVSVEARDGKMVLSDEKMKKEIASIEQAYDSGSLFLSMTDENTGFLLYCSSPAGGQMMKELYETKDRWQTYEKTDISQLIDGYPTSLSAVSDGHLYIGVQTHSDGYLFETADGGKSWKPVTVDKTLEKCRYGFAPVFDEKTGSFNTLLECDGYYSLYQSDAALSAWKLAGTFSMEREIQSFVIRNGEFIIADGQGQCWQLQP